MKSTHRPFSPSLMALCGVVVGMCLMTLGLVFVRDMQWFGPSMHRPMDPPSRMMVRREKPEQGGAMMKTSTSTSVVQMSTTTLEISTSTLMQAQRMFEASPFRVIQSMQSPSKQYIYMIATPRGATDNGCGSRYTQPVCYLLREPAMNAPTTTPTVVTSWKGGAFYNNTAVKFVKKGTGYVMQFMTAEGDGNCTIKYSHQIDLLTSEYSLLKQTDTCTK